MQADRGKELSSFILSQGAPCPEKEPANTKQLSIYLRALGSQPSASDSGFPMELIAESLGGGLPSRRLRSRRTQLGLPVTRAASIQKNYHRLAD